MLMSAGNVLEAWPPSRWDDYVAGFDQGYLEGLSRGREIADEEAAARQRAAARVVHYMPRVPVVDPVDSAARRARIDARFNGEGGA